METLNQKILDCKYCPFQEYKFNKKKELGFGVKHRIMFIVLAPAITRNRFTQDRSMKFFNEILQKVEITKDEYYFTHLIKTSIPSGKLPTEDEIKHCKSHLIEEIFQIKPQVIILLGKEVRNAFGVRWPYTFKNKRFKLDSNSFNVQCYSIPHPGLIYYRPEKETEYLKMLKKGLSNYKQILI